jgi:flagellar hook-length control protein FliK
MPAPAPASAAPAPTLPVAKSDDAASDTKTPAVLPTPAAPEKSAASADTRATSATPAQDSPRTDDGQTFDQIVLGLRSKFDPRAGKAEISLEPPTLGKLHVSISLDNGSLTAHFRAANESVRDLLNSNLDKLKGALESQGVAVDRLAVNASPDAPNTGGSSNGNNLAGSPNDGRSNGEYSREGSGNPQRDERRRQDPEAFAKLWQKAQAAAPIDVVA